MARPGANLFGGWRGVEPECITNGSEVASPARRELCGPRATSSAPPRRGDINRIDDHHSVAQRAQNWRLRFSPIAKQRMEKKRRRRWAMTAKTMRMK
jgi:hypothetical protein